MPSIREAWGSTLAQLTDENENLLIVDPDVANSTRADIVAGADLVAEQEVEIDGIPYLIRIRARSLAG